MRAGEHLLQLINEVLDLARIESGRLSISLESVTLESVFEEVFANVRPMASDAGIQVRDDTSDMSAIAVRADRTRLKQVLLNLLSNAIKYNRESGQVSLSVAGLPDKRVRINVSDTGMGMSTAQTNQLFQPFNRLGADNTEIEGTGIGLAISKRLVELMEGEIGVHSEVGVGSTFYIELPVTDLPATVVKEADVTAVETKQVLTGHTVLYVEDNPANLELVTNILTLRPDLNLLSATHAKLGIELAKAHRPDIIVLDINLPDIDGFEALRILLADPKTAEIPMIALSANAMPRDVERGLKAGFQKYLTKPINVREFLESLDEILGTSAV